MDPENRIMVSTISVWKVSQKCSLRKTKLSVTPDQIGPMLEKTGIEIVEPKVLNHSTFHPLANVDGIETLLIA